MALAVILNDVSAAHDFLCQLRVAQHAFANAKESGAGCITLEQREHPRRDIGIGPIIDRNGDARRRAVLRQAGPIRAQ
jgi:hypothetical protein